MRLLIFAVGASLPLTLGALLGVVWRPPQRVLATALAFAGLGFAAGALLFVVIDTLLDRQVKDGAVGFALLAGVTLDGVPENAALGVSLVEGGSVALLVAVFASNFPEALTGAARMVEQGRPRRQVILLWAGATILLAAAVLLGRLGFAGATDEQLSLPLTFAAGAVLASVIDTLAPEAFEEGGPTVALASAARFVTAFLLSA